MTDSVKRPFNRNGGLTLVPMPGSEAQATKLAELIETRRTDKAEGGGATKVDLAIPEFGYRGSGEPLIRLSKDHIGGHDCVVITSGPGTPLMIFQMLMLLFTLNGRKARRISVMSGYMPLSRSDKDEGTEELTLFSIIPSLAIASAEKHLFHRILGADLHADQLSGSARNGKVTGVTFMRQMLKRALTDAAEVGLPIRFAFTDGGARTRYEVLAFQVAEELGIKVACVYCDQHRTSSTKKELVGMTGDVDSIAGSVVITVDDEIATGGTNINTASLLREKYGPAQIWAVAVHGVLCGPAINRFGDKDCPIDRVYISDTIPERDSFAPLVQQGRLHVVSWLDHLASIVFFDHWDISIRAIR